MPDLPESSGDAMKGLPSRSAPSPPPPLDLIAPDLNPHSGNPSRNSPAPPPPPRAPTGQGGTPPPKPSQGK